MKKNILLLCLWTFLVSNAVSAQTPIGWRTDGTGSYPKADPPIKWGVDTNVVWKLAIPKFSVATPVIVGDKIFTCADPNTLLCISKTDGKILWERKCSYDEIPWTAEEKEKLALERKQADAWSKELQPLEKQANALEKQLRDDQKNKDLRKQRDALRNQIEDLRKKRRALPLMMRVTSAPRHGTAGYSQCTPVSDGKQIFVAFGNGLVACFDFDGTRRWLTWREHSTADYGHGSSPTLVAGKLIVHYADLAALDIKDGSESWRLKLRPLHGTCIPTRIGDTDVILSPMGVMVRVADGKVLADNLGQCGDNAPLLHNGIAYFISGNSKAVKLPDTPTGKPESLWKANLKTSDYWFSSPIYHDGLIYAINGGRNYSVLDAQTGKIVYYDRLEVGGRIYPSICFAGKYIYVSSDDGTTIVLQPGREYKEIARNRLEEFRSTPVFEGRRMYVRTQKHLWCIGQ